MAGAGPGGSRARRFLCGLDAAVTRNLRHARLRTRAGAGNGLWCCVLVPACLAVGTLRYSATPLHLVATSTSAGLLMYSLLFLVFASISMEALRERCYGGTFASSLLCTLLCFCFLEQGLLFSLVTCYPCVWLYNNGLRHALNAMPGCFTLGEAMVVLQAMTLFALAALLNMSSCVTQPPTTDQQVVGLIVQAGLMTVAMMIGLFYLLHTCKDARVILCAAGVPPLALLVFLHAVLGRSSLLWILEYITTDADRVRLVATWVVSVVMATLAVRYHTSEGQKATTSTRKIFHLFAVAVFLPGILVDPPLMTLAAGVAFAVLILLESIRVANIEPYSPYLHEAYKIYSDEKDAGGFSLTPLYLLAGVACPLALVPCHRGAELELLSGVLSIGVGDAAASWLGSRYGRHMWAGSRRTVEGTLVNILSQFATVFLLHRFGLLKGALVLRRAAVSSLVSGAAEACMDQVDNLVLPLITLLTLMVY